MIKTTLTLLFALLISGSCLAQSSLVLFDADGDRIGNFLQFVRDPAGRESYMRFATHDGYTFTLDSSGGFYRANGQIDYFYYETNDCTDRTYLHWNEATVHAALRGGEIMQIGSFTSSTFAKVEWTPPRRTFEYGSRSNVTAGGCESAGQDIPSATYILVTPVDPATYGIEYTGFWGFAPPFTSQVEKSNVISCDGFEACPVE